MRRAVSKRLLSSRDGFWVHVLFWAGELGSGKLCLGEFKVLFLCIVCGIGIVCIYALEVLAIDVDEAANGKQSREYVGHN